MSTNQLPVKLLVKPDNGIDLVVTRKVSNRVLANIEELDKRLNTPDKLPNPWFWPKKITKPKRASKAYSKSGGKKGFLGFGRSNFDKDLDDVEDKGYQAGIDSSNLTNANALSEKRQKRTELRDKYRDEYSRTEVNKLLASFDRGYRDGRKEVIIDRKARARSRAKASKTGTPTGSPFTIHKPRSRRKAKATP